jgi:hypothetical protein
MNGHGIARPLRRPLKIFAFDPMRGRDPVNVISVDVENEDLLAGPQGARVRVIDYDATHRRYHAPVDLDDPTILMQGGLYPSEADPRFHQQMAYAVTMKVLENFDYALGRRFSFRGSVPLLLLPHAFRGANAYYDPKLRGVCFGYFEADREQPGENIPGQPVFTCLSHDIIAHEVTHALVHRLRECLLEPTNGDVLAFHEGFSDIVAIFQHFSFPTVLRNAIRASRGDLGKSELVELAAQFGHATGRNDALRTAIDRPDPTRYQTVAEPHERGSLLVGAVFEGFFETFEERVRDLVRIATDGSGILPEGELPPDLVDRLATEAAEAAQTVLTMCIRAFEYLPPMDVTFGDFLRALVTADYDLLAEEGAPRRRRMIEAFRQRGIYPEDVPSLAEDALRWPIYSDGEASPMPAKQIADRLVTDSQGFHGSGPKPQGDPAARPMQAWAKANAERLHLDAASPIRLQGFHGTFRVNPSGQLQVEVVAQFTQWEDTSQAPEFGGLRMRGGSTVVATADGEVRYVIAKPLASALRRQRQCALVASLDQEDPAIAWADDAYERGRMTAHSFRALHQGLVLR